MHEPAELRELQGAVVQRRRQAKAVIDQRFLAGAVALEHAAHLRHADVGLVHEEQIVFGKIVEQAGRRLARLASVHVAGIVFDAVAVAQLLDHFEIELGTLFQALGLHQLALLAEQGKAFLQLLTDIVAGAFEVVLRGHEVAGRIQDGLAHLGQHVAGERVDLAHGVDVVTEEFQPQGPFVVIGRDDLQHVAPHPEGAAVEIVVVALVMHFHQPADERIHGEALADLHGNDHLGVVFRRTEAVDAGDRSHDDDVTPRQQGMCRRMSQLVDIVVDGRILFDVGVRGGHIGFRLIVIVIADEVFHGIAWKERAEFAVQLGGKGLVGGQHQRRTVAAGDEVGHGEGLARPCHPQQYLRRDTGLDIADELVDGLGLVARGLVLALQGKDGLIHAGLTSCHCRPSWT